MTCNSFNIRAQILYRAFYYPIVGDGIYVLIGGSVFIFVCDMIAQMTAAGFVLVGFSCGYLAAYFYEIVRATAIGDDRMPQWPSLVSWSESILEPLIMFYAAVILSFSPPLAYGIMISYKLTDPIFLICILVSTILLPSVLMSITFEDSLKGLLPWKFIKIMILDFRLYLMVVVIFQALLFAQVLFNNFAIFKMFSIVSYILNTVASLYGLFAMARCCGLFLRMNQDSLIRDL